MKIRSFFVAVLTPSASLNPKRFIPSLLAALLLAFPISSRGDYTATVNPNSAVVNNYLGWGVSLCWWANVVGSYANRDQYVDLAFTQLKLNIARYNIGGGENPTTNILTSYRAKMQGFEPTNGVWNWNADLNQRWVLKAAVARGVNLVDAFANSPPWWMTVSGSVTGSTNGTSNNLQTSYQNAFATYLATVVSNLTVLDGVRFNYVTPLNEPSGSWKYGGSQEGCHMTTAQQAPVITALKSALSVSLPSAGIDAPEDVDPYQSVTDLNSYSSTVLNDIALCTTHTYGVNGSSSLASKVSSLGKPFWVSEYGDNDATGLTMARRIHDDIVGMAARAWCYWQVVDSAGGWGFLYNPLTTNSSGGFTTNYTINQKFYVMGQFSKYIRPGCKIINVNDTNTLAAYTASNSTLVLVTFNTNTNNINVTYNVSAFGAVPWQVAVTQTMSGENMAAKPPLQVINNQFTSLIPAKSVTTFVLSPPTAPTVLSQNPATNSFTLYPGQTPTFSVTAAGSGPLYYKWLFNGTAVALTTNASFTPTAAQFTNVTNVVCIVTNSAGSSSSKTWSPTTVSRPTASYPQAVLALKPISYWRLDEAPNNGSGNNGLVCHDYAGGCNGVYSNVVIAQQGYSQLVEHTQTSVLFGSVLSANSAVSQINCHDFATPAGSNAEFSVSAWINGTGFQQTANAGIVTKGYFYGEELTLDEGAPGNCLRFSVRNAAGTVFSANSSINANTASGWHHLVGVCDEAKGVVSLYVDGVLTGSVAIPASSGITNSSAVPLVIGARASSATSGFNNQFHGWLDDVALFNYALNPNQVQTLYQAGVSLPPAGLTLTTLDSSHLQCNWNYGVLQCATNVAGPYQDMTNMPQPYTLLVTNSPQFFYRVRQN